jgi:hypothetical protein
MAIIGFHLSGRLSSLRAIWFLRLLPTSRVLIVPFTMLITYIVKVETEANSILKRAAPDVH